MNRDYLRCYLLLILVLIICAGVAWYLTSTSGMPADDAVLAKYPVQEEELGLAAPEVSICSPDETQEKSSKEESTA